MATNPNQVTSKELRILLDCLTAKYGPGYSQTQEIAALQHKLSVLLEIAIKRGR